MDQKSILEMAHGAVMERADLEMTKVMENIADPNTKATEKRVITLRLELAPDENRETIGVKATATSKLAATNSISTMLYVTGDENGEMCAVEATAQVPGQRCVLLNNGASLPNRVRRQKRCREFHLG
jgi:hypothetical protein